MGYLTVVASGQHLTVDIRTPGASEASVFSDAALSTPVTLPLAITADTDFYVGDANLLTVSVTTAAGVVLLDAVPVVVQPADHAVLYPRPSKEQEAATDSAVSGGSSPVTREWFNSRLAQEVGADHDLHQLSWVFSLGDDLFDLTDPKNPTPRVAGIYAVTINVCCDVNAIPLPLTGSFNLFVELDMDLDGIDLTSSSIGPINCDNQGPAIPQASVTGICYLPMGAIVAAYVNHNCGQDQSFFLEASVQRIS